MTQQQIVYIVACADILLGVYADANDAEKAKDDFRRENPRAVEKHGIRLYEAVVQPKRATSN